MNYGDPSFGDAIGQCLDLLEAKPVGSIFNEMKKDADGFLAEASAFIKRQKQYNKQLNK